VCAATAVASSVLAFPTPKQRQGWPLAELPRFVRMPVVRALAILLFFQSGNEFVLGGYIASFLTRELGVPIGSASYWLAAYWASIMAVRLVLSRLLLHVSAPAVVLASALLSAAGALTIGFSSTPALAGAGILLTGLALGGIFPTVLGLAGARFPEHSGTVFGILFTVALSGGMLMPWISGHLAEAAGLSRVFALVAINFAAIAVMALVVRRTPVPGPSVPLS
jgi:FHS family glucose/mannose:H+ symporter-like MFS transporter